MFSVIYAPGPSRVRPAVIRADPVQSYVFIITLLASSAVLICRCCAIWENNLFVVSPLLFLLASALIIAFCAFPYSGWPLDAALNDAQTSLVAWRCHGCPASLNAAPSRQTPFRLAAGLAI